jgi:biotin carboxyl carrier protein
MPNDSESSSSLSDWVQEQRHQTEVEAQEMLSTEPPSIPDSPDEVYSEATEEALDNIAQVGEEVLRENSNSTGFNWTASARWGYTSGARASASTPFNIGGPGIYQQIMNAGANVYTPLTETVLQDAIRDLRDIQQPVQMIHHVRMPLAVDYPHFHCYFPERAEMYVSRRDINGIWSWTFSFAVARTENSVANLDEPTLITPDQEERLTLRTLAEEPSYGSLMRTRYQQRIVSYPTRPSEVIREIQRDTPEPDEPEPEAAWTWNFPPSGGGNEVITQINPGIAGSSFIASGRQSNTKKYKIDTGKITCLEDVVAIIELMKLEITFDADNVPNHAKEAMARQLLVETNY